ncbi:MAG: alpha/beta hydrolase [Polyangiaceae bacterium]
MRRLLLCSLIALLQVGCARNERVEAPPVAPLSAATASPETAPTPEDAPTAVATAEPRQARFDSRLSLYEYPYPVSVAKLEAQGQSVEMAYMDVAPAAESHKLPVLLLHGKNFSGAYWERTIAALSKAGHRVIVPDQIGFGKSSKPTDLQYSFQLLATLTHQVVKQLGVDDLAVVGHSMGGMLATRYALMFPEETKRLVLVNPIGLEDWQRWVPYRDVETWYQRELASTPEGVKKYMLNAYFAGEWEADYDPLLEIQAGWATGPDKNITARVSALTYDMIFTQPVVHDFPLLTQPTLLIIGQRDRTALGKDAVAPEVAAKLGDYPRLGRLAKQRIPEARLVELPGVGHVPQYEAFDAYWKALSDFLR